MGESDQKIDDKKIDTYLLMIKKESSTNLNVQNSVLKKSKFIIDQIKFYKEKECKLFKCVDIGIFKDCTEKFNALINTEYDKVIQSSDSLKSLAGKFKFKDTHNCNDEALDDMCSDLTAELDLLQN